MGTGGTGTGRARTGGAWTGRAWAAVRDALVEAGGLVVPLACAGCGAWDVRLCGRCAAALRTGPVRVEDAAPRLAGAQGGALPVWACAPYAGCVRDVVVAWKDGGRLDLTTPLVGVVRRAARPLGPLLAAAARGPVVVVPVPSAAAARRRRGADLVLALARGAAAGLADGGADARVHRALVRRGGRDQAGLRARERARNAHGTWHLRSPVETGASHVLVDDVVTTGSTLAACSAVLSGSGGLVLGALTLAATPAPAHGTEGLRGPGDRG